MVIILLFCRLVQLGSIWKIILLALILSAIVKGAPGTIYLVPEFDAQETQGMSWFGQGYENKNPITNSLKLNTVLPLKPAEERILSALDELAINQ